MSSELQHDSASTPADRGVSNELSTGTAHELSAQVFSDPREFMQLLQTESKNKNSHGTATESKGGPHDVVIDGVDAGAHAVASDCSISYGISVDKLATDLYKNNLGLLSQQEPPLFIKPIFGDSPTFR